MPKKDSLIQIEKKNIEKKNNFWNSFLKNINNHRITTVIVLIFIILIILIIWTLSINNEVIISGGSTSVAPILNQITQQFYKDKNIDIIYNSLGSSAARVGVENKKYALGFLSKNINLTPKDGDKGLNAQNFWNNNNVNCFVFARDYIILVYNLPIGCSLINNKSLNFDEFFGGLGTNLIKKIYSHSISWQDAFPKKIFCSTSKSPFYTITREAGSGTRDFFENSIIKSKTYSSDCVVSSNGGMYQTISSTPGAIGYLSFSYLKQVADDEKLGLKFVFNVKSSGQEESSFQTDSFGKSIVDPKTGEYEFNNNYSLTRPFTETFNIKHRYIKEVLEFISWMLDPKPYYDAKILKIKELTPSDAAYWYLKGGVQPLTQDDPYFNKYNNNTDYAIKNWKFNNNYKSIWDLAVDYFNYQRYPQY